MPIREYVCPEHGKFERVIIGREVEFPKCPRCAEFCIPVEFSVPARRDPEKGIQK
jgi:hypothetical protein